MDSAWAFVAVGTRLEHLEKSWVKYEWRNFHNDMLSRRKPENSPFVAFTDKIDLGNLPRPFRNNQGVPVDGRSLSEGLEILSSYMRKPGSPGN